MPREEITTGGTLTVELSNLVDEGGNVTTLRSCTGRCHASGDDGFSRRQQPGGRGLRMTGPSFARVPGQRRLPGS
jgi:hypothetical protein